MLVCYDSSVSWKNPHGNLDAGIVDTTIVATHMMLEVADLGLGTTFVCHVDPEKIKATFELPDYLIPVALLPIGYPGEKSTPHVDHSKRNNVDDFTFFDSFDGITEGKIDPDQHKSLEK